MFKIVTAATLLACSALLVRADPDPNVPGPGEAYNQGANCPIAWAADPTGTWKTMTIQLMTGDNLAMVPLTTVASNVDATSTGKLSFNWTCPEVNPNSAIYFYQFTDPVSKDFLWTTRFAIASSTGQTTPPPNATQPNGQAVPWGTGSLVNGSTSGTTSGTPSVPPSVSSAVPSAPSTIASSSVVPPPGTTPGSSDSGVPSSPAAIPETPTGTTTGSAAGASGSAAGNTANSALTTLNVDQRSFQVLALLGISAAGFITLL